MTPGSYAVIDEETTGLSPLDDHILGLTIKRTGRG
jgi:hypothetical protein